MVNRRLVAVLGGGDWADASINHITVPANVDLDAVRAEHQKWYREVYCPALREQQRNNLRTRTVDYMNFVDYLKAHYGAVDATETDITILED